MIAGHPQSKHFHFHHPCHLLYALCVTIDTGIIAHYIAYSFYEI